MYSNKKLLEACRNMPCGSCFCEDGTVVAAHRNQGKGMGIKVSDALVASLCFKCHAYLDQGKEMSREERRDFWNQAYINTMQAMIERGILKVQHGTKN
jgi:hypothetical protein